MNKEELLESRSNRNTYVQLKEKEREQVASDIEKFLSLGGKIEDLGGYRAQTVSDPTIGQMFRHGVDYAAKRTGVSIALIRRACREGWGPDFSFEHVRTTKELRFTTAALDAWKPKIAALVKEYCQ